MTTDIVDRRDEDGGTRVAANFGQDDGITADSSFVLCYPDGRHVGEGELTLVEILPHHTWLRTRKTTFQTGLLVEASIPPEPEAPEEGPMLHGDGSIGDDDASRLEA
ncbi:MAG: hypothetical protein IPL61_27620 [Myxococcales bacterium]|nr:hypothetical protein [Myxococcales bacterium]